MRLGKSNWTDAGKVAPPLEYVGAEWIAEHITGTTQQNVSKTAKAMLKPGYRGKEERFPRPHAVVKGRNGKETPLWLASWFESEES